MSVSVMSAVWAIDLPASQKIVLLALADAANDDGHCWPGMASLSRKCSKSERTVQAMLVELETAGHLTRIQNPGKGCNYYVHPRRTEQPMQGYHPPETHYVYRIESPATGEFYIGARTCVGPVEDDDYMGSGNWVKLARAGGLALRKVVLETLISRADLAAAELTHVEPVFADPLCMNAKLPTPGTLTPTGHREGGAIPAPRNSRTPQKTAQTPAKSAPKPSRTQKIKNTETRAHVLRDDWEPKQFGPKTKSRAVVDGWPPGEAEAQIEHFTAHHRGKGNRFTDWQDAWSTWVLNGRRFTNGRLSGQDNRGSLRGSRPDPALDMLYQAQRELQAEAERENPRFDRPLRLAVSSN